MIDLRRIKTNNFIAAIEKYDIIKMSEREMKEHKKMGFFKIDSPLVYDVVISEVYQKVRFFIRDTDVL